MLYSAIVKDKESKRRIVIREQEYPNKSEFIHDLRHNGYAVNPLKVKKSKVFDYIMEHTNYLPWDWKENN
jgi:hypothetical protein